MKEVWHTGIPGHSFSYKCEVTGYFNKLSQYCQPCLWDRIGGVLGVLCMCVCVCVCMCVQHVHTRISLCSLEFPSCSTGPEPYTLYVLGEHCSPELHPSPERSLCMGTFKDESGPGLGRKTWDPQSDGGHIFRKEKGISCEVRVKEERKAKKMNI